jgi:hypothetical protein
MIRYAGYRGVHLSSSQSLLVHHFSGCCLNQWRTSEEDPALILRLGQLIPIAEMFKLTLTMITTSDIAGIYLAVRVSVRPVLTLVVIVLTLRLLPIFRGLR